VDRGRHDLAELCVEWVVSRLDDSADDASSADPMIKHFGQNDDIAVRQADAERISKDFPGIWREPHHRLLKAMTRDIFDRLMDDAQVPLIASKTIFQRKPRNWIG
jgi:hypothetical protein